MTNPADITTPKLPDTPPRSSTRAKLRTGILGLGVAALATATSCSAATESVVGLPPDPDVKQELILHQGSWPSDQFEDAIDILVSDAAHNGRQLRVHIVNTGNADSIVTALEVDLRRQSRTASNREEEAEHNHEEAMDVLLATLRTTAGTGTGDDLFGAVRNSAERDQADEVILLTGGGTHITPQLNLTLDSADQGDLPQVEAPGTKLVVIGAGEFSDSGGALKGVFTTRVNDAWDQACEQWHLETCQRTSTAAAASDLLEPGQE